MKRHADNLAVAALVALVALASVLGLGQASLADATVVGVYAALFVPWAGLLWLSGKRKLDWRWLLAAAVAVRVVLLFADPRLSDDIFRYVWDGRVAASGVNPFVYAPASEVLAPLRDPQIWARVNHPEIPTIYPPAAQMLFGLNALLGGGTRLLRVLLLLVEAGGVALVGWLVRSRAGSPRTDVMASTDRARSSVRGLPALDTTTLQRAFITYALCPLVFVETAWSGHVDVLAWAPLVVSLLLLGCATSRRALLAAGALFGVSIAAKFLGLIAAPLILLGYRRRHEATWADAARRRTIFLATAAAVVLLCYLPYMGAGARLFSGFGTYASSWEANDGPFRAASYTSEASMEAWAPPKPSRRFYHSQDGKLIVHFYEHDKEFEARGWTRIWRGRTLPNTSFAADQIAHTVSKGVAAFILGLAMLWALIVRRDLLAGTLTVLLALFFVAPVVHPWYVAWLIPLAALRRSRAALLFAFVVLAAYLAWVSVRAGGAWQVPVWALVVEFGVVGLVAWWEMGRLGDGG